MPTTTATAALKRCASESASKLHSCNSTATIASIGNATSNLSTSTCSGCVTSRQAAAHTTKTGVTAATTATCSCDVFSSIQKLYCRSSSTRCIREVVHSSCITSSCSSAVACIAAQCCRCERINFCFCLALSALTHNDSERVSSSDRQCSCGVPATTTVCGCRITCTTCATTATNQMHDYRCHTAWHCPCLVSASEVKGFEVRSIGHHYTTVTRLSCCM